MEFPLFFFAALFFIFLSLSLPFLSTWDCHYFDRLSNQHLPRSIASSRDLLGMTGDSIPSTSSSALDEDFLRKLLDAKVRVTAKDGRKFEGTLSCVDQQGNLIINNGVELRIHPGGRRVLNSTHASASSFLPSFPSFVEPLPLKLYLI